MVTQTFFCIVQNFLYVAFTRFYSTSVANSSKLLNYFHFSFEKSGESYDVKRVTRRVRQCYWRNGFFTWKISLEALVETHCPSQKKTVKVLQSLVLTNESYEILLNVCKNHLLNFTVKLVTFSLSIRKIHFINIQ